MVSVGARIIVFWVLINDIAWRTHFTVYFCSFHPAPPLPIRTTFQGFHPVSRYLVFRTPFLRLDSDML